MPESNKSRKIIESIKRLKYLCNIIPPLLEKIPRQDFLYKPRPDKWSKQEILGHLIDSATNNHHRFIRTQIEDTPAISYNQDQWNKCSAYNRIDSSHLINFWEAYNRQIVFVVSVIPEEVFYRKCRINEADSVTLKWLFEDYVIHLEHHLKQLVKYE